MSLNNYYHQYYLRNATPPSTWAEFCQWIKKTDVSLLMMFADSTMIFVQIGLALLTFASTMVFIILPAKFIVQNQGWLKKFISLANCFSAGIFIGTCYLQMIPMLEEEMNKIAWIKATNRIPFLVQFMVILGFFLVLFVEVFARRCKGETQSHEPRPEVKQYHPLGNESSDERDVVNLSRDWPENNRNGGITFCDHENTVSDINEGLDLTCSDLTGHYSHFVDGLSDGSLSVGTLLMVVALSVHSVFEGLAIGLQTQYKPLFNLYLGVIIHEVFVAFAMGVNLCRHDFTRSNTVKLAITLSSMIPIGIAAGLCFTALPKTSAIAMISCVMQSLAAGTFVYVVFVEILPEELLNPQYHLSKAICILLGVSTMTVLAFYLH